MAFITLAAMNTLCQPPVADISTLDSGKLRRAAVTQQVAVQVVPPRRGTITDLKGVPLAVSQAASDISATPYLVKDPVKAAAALAPLLHVDSAALTQKLARHDTGFVYLARQVPAVIADRVQKLNIAGIDLAPA